MISILTRSREAQSTTDDGIKLNQKSVRSGHRGIVTKKLETVLGITPPDTHTLEQLRAALEEKRNLFTNLDKRIVSLLNDETEIIAEIEGAEGVRMF